MIVAWFTDLHVHNFRKFDVNGSRLENTLNVVERVFAFAHKNGLSHVLFSGDLFDQQKVLPAIVVNAITDMFSELFEKYPDITLLAITGNHDQATINLGERPAVSALTFLDSVFPNFKLIDNDMVMLPDGNVVCGIPYYEHPEHFKKALIDMNTRIEEGTEYNVRPKFYLMIHQTPSGLSGGYRNIPVDIEHDSLLFDPYELVLCGHIHVKHELGKLIVGGSPIQKDFSDVDDEKGYWAVDLNTGKYQFRSLQKFYPKFVRIKEGEQVDVEETDYVEVIPVMQAITKEEEEHVEMYRADNTPKELLTNFWQETEGKDEKLLETGLGFLN